MHFTERCCVKQLSDDGTTALSTYTLHEVYVINIHDWHLQGHVAWFSVLLEPWALINQCFGEHGFDVITVLCVVANTYSILNILPYLLLVSKTISVECLKHAMDNKHTKQHSLLIQGPHQHNKDICEATEWRCNSALIHIWTTWGNGTSFENEVIAVCSISLGHTSTELPHQHRTGKPIKRFGNQHLLHPK